MEKKDWIISLICLLLLVALMVGFNEYHRGYKEGYQQKVSEVWEQGWKDGKQDCDDMIWYDRTRREFCEDFKDVYMIYPEKIYNHYLEFICYNKEIGNLSSCAGIDMKYYTWGLCEDFE